ncbi:MAG: TetR/AcrR family transcriptional regulator [Chloroflexia bacterium]|nr:TetR/AcrR family transcriptional regulator [Chloroflexia bacterium]
MTNVVNTTRGYFGHRERQRERILMTAEQLFTRDGISNVSIADIADAVGMTRATIYRYFANRIEIAWALQRRYSENLINSMPSDVTNANLLGLTRLRALLRGFCDYFFQYPERALYVAQLDRLQVNPEDNAQLVELRRNDMQTEDPIAAIIVLGIRDGSLRANLDANKTSTTIYTMIWGLERRLAASTATFEGEYHLSQRAIYEDACQIIIQGLIARQ